MEALLFGTAGIPLSANPRTTLSGVPHIRALGLGAMELEFVHSVTVSEKSAPEIKALARDNGVKLTCHGQYYMNLNAKEQAKKDATMQRILKAARMAWKAGAWSLCFHAAYYMGDRPEQVYATVKASLEQVQKQLAADGNGIWIRPELTGKGTQFGTLEELLKLSAETEQIMPCIDFSHCHARYNGKFNTYQEFCWILAQVEKALGRQGLDNIHAHVSGINYGPKGEKNHLPLQESDFNYLELLKAMKAFKAKGVVICESPNLETDALLLQKAYGKC
ncbi:MAG: TIM barrel protein [Candidatus Aenigmarchaeota archaeon]|nr:TIM barrel protein [Candidatus Aenigmarchaeota archaeon]